MGKTIDHIVCLGIGAAAGIGAAVLTGQIDDPEVGFIHYAVFGGYSAAIAAAVSYKIRNWLFYEENEVWEDLDGGYTANIIRETKDKRTGKIVSHSEWTVNTYMPWL